MFRSGRNIKRLPSFFVLGAQKSGTTTLHEWLKLHPDICLPYIKETHFFSRADRYRRGIEWYSGQFSNDREDVIYGEIDPDYLFFEEASFRIKNYMDSPKFICLFRNPIDRAFSHYQMSVRRGYEEMPFNSALLEEPKRLMKRDDFALNHHSYLARSFYSRQVTRYIEQFPDSEFFFIKFEELFGTNTRYVTYERICRFIGIKSPIRATDLTVEGNRANKPRSIFLRDILYKSTPLRKTLSKLISSPDIKHKLWVLLDRLNQSPLQENEKRRPDQIPENIRCLLIKDLLKLRKITNLDFTDWIDRMQHECDPKA